MAAQKTLVRSCSCSNEGQDALYGKGQRVMNETADNPPKKRCTVCKKEH
jgi:hypothetical protein